MTMQPEQRPQEPPAPYPELTAGPMRGDSSLMMEAIRQRNAREVVAPRLRRQGDISIMTQVAEDLRTEFASLRAEIKADIPAGFMKRRLTRRQQRAQVARMTPEQRMAIVKKFGARRVAKYMLGLEPQKREKSNAGSDE